MSDVQTEKSQAKTKSGKSSDVNSGSKGVKRNKKSFFNWNKKRKNNSLEAGLKGFLCFCNYREKECIREAMNLLNTYSYENTNTNIPTEDENQILENDFEDISVGEEGIEEALSNEIEAAKRELTNKERKFQVVESGAKNIVFIRTTVEETVEIATSIMKEINATKEHKTRFLIRLVPIEITCKANLEDIKKSITSLLDQHLKEPSTFSVVFNHRNNSSVDRDELIKEIAKLVVETNSQCTVNLKEPNLSIIVEIIRGICLLSVIPEYMKLKKFNLHMLSGQTNEIKESTSV